MKELIVVTGGSKGIGRAIVEKFAGAGFPVATCSRNLQNLEQLKNEVDGDLHVFQADLSTKSEVLGFAKFINGLNIPVGVLVNNTGFFIPGKIYEEEDGQLEAMMETNLYSAYHLTRALIGGMIERKSGHIFSMGSIAGLKAYENGGSYSISKFAMQGFTLNLREETKDLGIRVTSINPGATFTASWEGADIEEDRLMPSEDIAEAVYSAYTMSDRTVVEEIVIRPQKGDL